MSPDMIGFAILLAGVLLLVAKIVRVRWGAMQRWFIPSSIIGGFIALALGPEILGALVGATAGEEAALAGGLFPEGVMDVWSELPGLLISVVFATLFLGHRIPAPRQIWELGGPQLSLGVTMGAGQYVIGILLTVLLLTPVFGINPMAGALIEIGFEGGHGTAAGLAGTFDELGFPEGADLALGMATIGVVTGVVIGMFLINWGVRRNRTAFLKDRPDTTQLERSGFAPMENREPAAMLTVRPESIEPLSIHFALVGVAVVIGAAILNALQWIEGATWGDQVELLEHVPLFPLAMIGGVIVQLFVDRFDHRRTVDRLMMIRIQGLALDVLVVTALATLSLQVIAENLGPFVILALAGVGWNIAVFVLLAHRMIPTFPFERGIADLGQSLGVTATGLLLLRVVDPEIKTPALEAFGYKQLGFEPFLGGGLITGIAVPLIAAFGPYPLLGMTAAMLAVALGLGLLYFGRMEPTPQEVASGGGGESG